MPDTKILNKDQLKAIKHGKGPLLIIAGAGTGKTTVITERIKHLIATDLAKPQEILALTFTEKAAREMEERVDQAMPYSYTQMWISTFHSFCDRVLRDEALAIGLDTRYRLMTEAESTKLFRDHLFDFDLDYFRPLGNPTKFISGILQHFSRLQDEDVSPTHYTGWVQTQKSKLKSPSFAKASKGKQKSGSEEEKQDLAKWKELANAYKKWNEIKAKESAMDFGDLIVNALELFRKRPNILKVYQQKFKYILVDEFQDTNIAQYELLKLLAPPGKNANISVVGDDSQSIYKFRGAAISNILHFMDDYKTAKQVILTKNYRSTQTILDSSYKLIQHNNPDTLETQLGIAKDLVSTRKLQDAPEIGFIHESRVENEAEEVANKISELTSKSSKLPATSTSYNYSDFAILVRANAHAEAFQHALSRAGVPYQFLGPGRLFKQPEIIDLISFLKVLYDFDDSVALYRLLSIDQFKVPARDLIILGNFARWGNHTLYEACQKVSDSKASEKSKDKIKSILKIIEKGINQSKSSTAGQILYNFLEEADLLQQFLNSDDADSEKRAQNISKFFAKLKTYETDHEDASVRAVVDWIDLATELGESPLAADTDWTQVNAVNIMTIHSAKGLEFPVVFLVNLVSQRFPSTERREQIPIPDELIKEVLPQGDFHTQEERRLFYVGMTRAQNYLFLTSANFYGEAKREKKLSPFIFEALGDEVLSAEQQKPKGDQLSFLDYTPTSKPSSISHHPLAIHVDYLSYSQIETFKLCPLHYKLRYILNIPTPPTAALSYGSTLHNTLNDFYHAVARGKKPTKKLILDLLAKNWIHIGYHSRSHEQQRLKKGQDTLVNFIKNEYNSDIKTITLEQPFTIPLEPPASKKETPLKIGGRIDRIDKTKNGIEIVDYKTGANVPTQAEVDKNDQLTIYTIAATQIPDFPFGRKPEQVKLTLHYIEEGKKLSTIRTQDQLKKSINEIFKTRSEIESSDFKCSRHFFCQTGCEYKMFCDTGSST